VRTFALVPLNGLDAAKSRLAGSLTDADRRRLVRWMADRVVGAALSSGVVEAVAVISPDPALLAWARARGAAALRQHAGELNDGLELGRRWALARGADAVLVLLGDLALLRGSEVAELVARARGGAQAVVIAPDRASQGTNALLVRPATLMPFAFGERSYGRHLALARDAGVEPAIYRSPGTQFDVDTAGDLAELRELADVPFALPVGTTYARGEGA
jgi:2-phospho-L-lactate/phosphoenolpyruvate guanylyltransferase